MDREAAADIAIAALGFIAADEKLLPRFLALTGLDPAQLRDAAREPGFLPGVLDFMLGHEPTLLAFCQASGVTPETVPAARAAFGPSGETAP
ncbi:DUF3572 domain-containing protein [Jiella sp. MQZ9-1]|uniref:DUF3572 domain-containing protein n=1 Tax=Jiella flava TaxID=2816857 RepID=A0A939JWT4_9HYPH|nr:DUF3572 domain-containing protein [Jiella flava]MCD2471068.1 DUF3572 domain-containing protein [Jiella flava]